jgi:hypothetical protein
MVYRYKAAQTRHCLMQQSVDAATHAGEAPPYSPHMEIFQ